MAGNYRLKNDIDFSGSYSDDVRIRGTFTGTLDGDGHTLKNLQEIQYGSVFETISKGIIENLTVEGLKLSSNHQSATLRTGFAGTMKDSASMDHVFVVGTAGYDTVDVYGYGGVLAGEMNNVSITNCGVRDMELVSQEIQKNTLYLGGLAGSLSSTNVANSYVQGTTITADAGYTAVSADWQVYRALDLRLKMSMSREAFTPVSRMQAVSPEPLVPLSRKSGAMWTSTVSQTIWAVSSES